MYSPAEHYRRRGIKAQQRAAQAADPSIKWEFEDVPRDWFALAEQAEWLEKHFQPAQSKEPQES
jgi:hypothetical protein